MLSLIAAIAHNNVIGMKNRLPWRLPADLMHFKTITLGKPIVMGRKTYESIGKPLPGRTNIVISRNNRFVAEGVLVVHSLQEALATTRDVPETMLIGGAQLYAEALAQAQRMYLTVIDAEFVGDAFFPAYNPREWREVAREHHTPDEDNSYAYSFTTLERPASVA